MDGVSSSGGKSTRTVREEQELKFPFKPLTSHNISAEKSLSRTILIFYTIILYVILKVYHRLNKTIHNTRIN